MIGAHSSSSGTSARSWPQSWDRPSASRTAAIAGSYFDCKRARVDASNRASRSGSVLSVRFAPPMPISVIDGLYDGTDPPRRVPSGDRHAVPEHTETLYLSGSSGPQLGVQVDRPASTARSDAGF